VAWFDDFRQGDRGVEQRIEYLKNKDVHDRCVRPVLGRTSSPLLQNLIFGTDSGGPVIRPGSPSLI